MMEGSDSEDEVINSPNSRLQPVASNKTSTKFEGRDKRALPKTVMRCVCRRSPSPRI